MMMATVNRDRNKVVAGADVDWTKLVIDKNDWENKLVAGNNDFWSTLVADYVVDDKGTDTGGEKGKILSNSVDGAGISKVEFNDGAAVHNFSKFPIFP